MNTLIFVGLFMCVFVACTSALPYPSKVVAETEPKGEGLVALDTESEGESLVPVESAWRGRGWGYSGGSRGWGHVGHGWSQVGGKLSGGPWNYHHFAYGR